MLKTHRTIKELSKENIQLLSKKSKIIWLKDAILDWCIIAITFACLGYLGPFFILPAILIIGNRQHALTVLGHEGAHFTLSQSRKINDIISDIFSFSLLGLTTSGYRNVHMQHHKFTNMFEDPELTHRAARAPQWDLPIKLPKILKYAALDLIGYSLTDYIIIVSFSKPSSPRSYITVAVMNLVFVSSLVATGNWWVAAIWYACLPTSFMTFFRLRTLLEHLGTDETHRVHLNFIERCILAPHNIWYHWEHHHYPMIAYHNLPIVRKKLPNPNVIDLKGLLDFLSCSPKVKSGAVLKPNNSSLIQLIQEAA